MPDPSTSNNLFLKLHTKSDSDFVRLPLQTYLYSATAAEIVQSRLREPCIITRNNYVRQKRAVFGGLPEPNRACLVGVW